MGGGEKREEAVHFMFEMTSVLHLDCKACTFLHLSCVLTGTLFLQCFRFFSVCCKVKCEKFCILFELASEGYFMHFCYLISSV